MPYSLSLPHDSSEHPIAETAVGGATADDRAEAPAKGLTGRVHELPPPPPLPGRTRPVAMQSDATQPGAWRAWWRLVGRRLSSAFTISLLVHCFVLLIMAVIVHASLPGSSFSGLVAYSNVAVPLPDEGLDSLPVQLEQPDRDPGERRNDAQELEPVKIDPLADATAAELGAEPGEAPRDRSAELDVAPAGQPDWLLSSGNAGVQGGLMGRGRGRRGPSGTGRSTTPSPNRGSASESPRGRPPA